MTILQSGVIPSTGGYQIERSLRFNSADSAYLNRTFGSNGNQKAWTLSFWVKRSKLGDFFDLFGVNSASPDQKNFRFNTDDTLTFYVQTSAATVVYLQTSQVFRDVSAWYHVVLVIDTANATSTDRIRLYANGSRITAFSSTTYPSLNLNIPSYNTAIAHYLGSFGPGTSLFNGYMTEINFIDGQALTPSSFGETDSATGVWKPKAYTSTYGTNGFYLKFADNSGTTSTTLGKDSSGNGNNWTPNNFSVTAGAGNDSLVDSPTSYGTDTGVGGEVRGNYCTINAVGVGLGTLSNGNLQLSATASAYQSRSSTIAVSSGKWYWEVTILSGGNYQILGIDTPGRNYVSGGYVGDATSGRGWTNVANTYVGGSATSYGATYTTNDVLGFALDMDAGTLVCYKNGVSQGTAFSGITGTQTPAFSVYTSGVSIAINFGQRPFEKWNGSAFVANTAPSGFKALCTQNLPTPTIGATSTTQANDYMNVVTWSGNNVTPRTISGLDFQPDFVWLKDRTVAHNNYLYDAVRGAGNNSELSSNSTGQEGSLGASEYGYVSAFTSNGFTLTGGTDPTYYMADVNYPGSNFVGWNWKANGAGSTNSNGTAKSSSVTVDSSTDTVTWNSHGMSNGQKIGFFATTMPGGLSAGTLYYVRDAATNTFKVAASSGGAAIDITSNGTTVTAHTTLTSTVSANTTSGFSIVTYTGSGSNATVEHGLGVAPSMVIVKRRDAGSSGWSVYFTTLAAGYILALQSTGAQANAPTRFTTTLPTSTVFSIGTDSDLNASAGTYVAYCFAPVAGYSAFGSYTGNGSTDGPFVYTGFRPRYVLIKRTDVADDWGIFDTARDTYNTATLRLRANDPGAELSTQQIDINSNGFKIRVSNAAFNANTGTYIYAAFAESPFKYSLAR